MRDLFLFETQPSDEKEFDNSIINASHAWGLPGVICTACGNTWSDVGLAYPLVSLSGLPSKKGYETSRAVPLKEFEFLRDGLLSAIPAGTLILPGTEFGPLVGKVSGTFGDFAWLNPWTPLITIEAYQQLKNAGVRLPKGANHRLVFGKRRPNPLVELQIEPFASLESRNRVVPCVACGYVFTRLPSPIVIKRSTVPDFVDVFRAKDFTTLILATENFVNATNDLGLTGIKFRQMAVST